MKNLNFEKNLKLIKEARKITMDKRIFYNSTLLIQSADFGIEESEYRELMYKLKALRQDFVKIITTLELIEEKFDKFSKKNNLTDKKESNEICCLMEYLFIKYRVMIEYVFKVLEICLFPKLSIEKKKEYEKHKKRRNNILLQYLNENLKKENVFLNTEWFQQFREDRNVIVHGGATCLIFGTKDRLKFRVLETNAMDDDITKEYEEFFMYENDVIDYSRFWALHISKLIIFCETIFDILIEISNREDEKTELIDFFLEYHGILSKKTTEAKRYEVEVILKLFEKVIKESE